MSKVITFSRQFPKHHPKAGEPTFFVEKLWSGIPDTIYTNHGDENLHEHYLNFLRWKYEPKIHTIRAGERYKRGDLVSLRVWSGKPYASKQVEFAADVSVVKTIPFEIDLCGIYLINGKYIDEEHDGEFFPTEHKLAKNDGLTSQDLFDWFMPNFSKPKPFKGQIICFQDVEY